ncbi:MAG: 2-oxo acid dehydrogenase subunit E2 [Bacteriovoracaceae bacterium]|jgi:pyruvate dehydrogenase E2 component (dihydrolipoamide acetyltransferase)|nr:2-oxo acid dehydrogenase subunit E2 [Bacteriovoracaceae bacterium]
MAKIEIVMPQMGESITNGTITKWHKKVGDSIELDEILLEISTDKVESEIPSSTEGRVAEILYEEGETIDVGLKICVIEDDPKATLVDSSGTFAMPLTPTTIETKNEVAVEMQMAVDLENIPAKTSSRKFYTPLVRAMAKEYNVTQLELEGIKGSGTAGRVNKHDLLGYIENRKTDRTFTAEQAVAGVTEVRANGSRVEIIPMDNMRKAIAKNMVMSKQTAPHVNSVDEIDFTNIVKFREGFKNEFKKQEGFSLTYTHFILYALVQALKEFPLVNASVEGDNIIVKKDINLGCAVAVPGNGLVVPTIKSADSLNITGIAREVNILANKARSKKLTMDDLTGGTFTFTNVGSFGTLMATPVILQPQVGIFASGVIKKRPMVTADDAIAIRSMMYGTHTYDHRLVDGELGGLFLRAVKNNIENLDAKSLF